MEWAIAHGIDVPATKKSPYSIDDNLSGPGHRVRHPRDPWMEPPSDIYTMTADSAKRPMSRSTWSSSSRAVCLTPSTATRRASSVSSTRSTRSPASTGYGRIDMIENRLVGVKSRRVLRVPGALSLIQAHKALEDLVLGARCCTSSWAWSRSGRSACTTASGSRRSRPVDVPRLHAALCGRHGELKFYKGSCTVVGRKSAYSYTTTLATYDKDDSFDHAAAKGFIQLQTLSARRGPRTVGRRARRPSCSTRRRRSAR